MNTMLTAIDEEDNEYKISVDLKTYEIEEDIDGYCIISQKMGMKEFRVKENFQYLHICSNGHNISHYLKN